MHQRIDAGRAGALLAHCLDQLVGQLLRLLVCRALRRATLQLRQQPLHRLALVAPVGAGDGGAQRGRRRQQLGLQRGKWGNFRNQGVGSGHGG